MNDDIAEMEEVILLQRESRAMSHVEALGLTTPTSGPVPQCCPSRHLRWTATRLFAGLAATGYSSRVNHGETRSPAMPTPVPATAVTQTSSFRACVEADT